MWTVYGQEGAFARGHFSHLHKTQCHWIRHIFRAVLTRLWEWNELEQAAGKVVDGCSLKIRVDVMIELWPVLYTYWCFKRNLHRLWKLGFSTRDFKPISLRIQGRAGLYFLWLQLGTGQGNLHRVMRLSKRWDRAGQFRFFWRDQGEWRASQGSELRISVPWLPNEDRTFSLWWDSWTDRVSDGYTIGQCKGG
jgi:hypothetical protein